MNNDIKDHVIVKDNFFRDEIYKELLLDIHRLIFKNRYPDVGKKGDYVNKTYFHVKLNLDHFAVKEVSKILKNYKFNLSNMEHSYILTTKHEKPTPHVDVSDVNCLVYIEGNNVLNNGTGFYDSNYKNDYDINNFIGFKENRAIIFDPKIYHGSLQFNEGSGKRFAMANFFKFKKNKEEKEDEEYLKELKEKL